MALQERKSHPPARLNRTRPTSQGAEVHMSLLSYSGKWDSPTTHQVHSTRTEGPAAESPHPLAFFLP